MIRKNLRENYSPLYFLSALGAGGLAITFFIYLTFMVSHPDTPMVTFNHLWPIVTDGDPVTGALIGMTMLGIAFFTLLHLRLLAWNLVEFARFRRTEAYEQLFQSNNEATLMTLPLTLAMTINVLFVNGAVFVPNLWSVVEYLFPFAILAWVDTLIARAGEGPDEVNAIAVLVDHGRVQERRGVAALCESAHRLRGLEEQGQPQQAGAP